MLNRAKGGQIWPVAFCIFLLGIYSIFFVKQERNGQVVTEIQQTSSLSKSFPCHNNNLKTFNDTNRNLTALISAPGSGNSWVRHLLQTSTGYQTGSVYGDGFMFEHGFPGEKTQDGRVLIIKDHFFHCSHPELELSLKHNYSKAVIIVRNPINSALAEYSRQNTKHHNQTGLLKVANFTDEKWPAFARKFFTHWLTLYDCVWKTFPNINDRCVLHFEELTGGNLLKELEKCLNFLGFSLNPEKINCLMDSLEGDYHRPSRSSTELEMILYPFDKQELKLMKDSEELYLNRLKYSNFTLKV